MKDYTKIMNEAAAKNGHVMTDIMRHRAHVYSGECSSCGAMLFVNANKQHGAIIEMTCSEYLAMCEEIKKQHLTSI